MPSSDSLILVFSVPLCYRKMSFSRFCLCKHNYVILFIKSIRMTSLTFFLVLLFLFCSFINVRKMAADEQMKVKAEYSQENVVAASRYIILVMNKAVQEIQKHTCSLC